MQIYDYWDNHKNDYLYEMTDLKELINCAEGYLKLNLTKRNNMKKKLDQINTNYKNFIF